MRIGKGFDTDSDGINDLFVSVPLDLRGAGDYLVKLLKAAFVLALIVVPVLAVLSYRASRQYQPLTAKEIEAVITSRKPYGSDPARTTSCKEIRNRSGAMAVRLYSERPLAQDALEVIAASDIDFMPYYQLDSDARRVLRGKKKGWVILTEGDNHLSRHFFNGEKDFADSTANVWLLHERIDLGRWQHHKGMLRISFTNSYADKTDTSKWIDLLNKYGKRVELVDFDH